jgi:hypothetical protein
MPVGSSWRKWPDGNRLIEQPSERSSAGDQLEENHDQRNDQQQMDKTTGDMECEEA